MHYTIYMRGKEYFAKKIRVFPLKKLLICLHLSDDSDSGGLGGEVKVKSVRKGHSGKTAALGVLIVLVMLTGFFFRFYRLPEIPPGLYPDEAMNGNNAQEALLTDEFKSFYPENNGREGLFINMQAFSLRVFGPFPWALRLVSAIFGLLTVWGIYLLAKILFPISELFVEGEEKNFLWDRKDWVIAVLSSFFLATNFWHINFSRIGFRAILVPFFAVFAAYFLWRGLRERSLFFTAAAGVFVGLGMQTYIAFRFMPLVFMIPLVWIFCKEKNTLSVSRRFAVKAFAVLTLVSLIVFLPLGVYFMQNPADFLGRSGQVSVFSSVHPLWDFFWGNLKTLGMFFVRGDCNWRHNYDCIPELNPLVALFFLVGVIKTVKSFFRRSVVAPSVAALLLGWLFLLSLPATLTQEGLPHALRSIGMIPPIMILAGLGAWWSMYVILLWLGEQIDRNPNFKKKIKRIRREMTVLFLLALMMIPLASYRDYFLRWAINSNTYFSFSADVWNLGEYLDNLPPNLIKYVVVNQSGESVRGIPMPAQTVMFATETFDEYTRQAKNIIYILPENIEDIKRPAGREMIIGFLNGKDLPLINNLQKKFPELHPEAPGDFVILGK